MTKIKLPKHVEAQPDSDDWPIAILLQDSTEIAESYCDECGEKAEDWNSDRSWHPCDSKPGAMYKAALYCSDCMPSSYNDDGERVSTFWGE